MKTAHEIRLSDIIAIWDINFFTIVDNLTKDIYNYYGQPEAQVGLLNQIGDRKVISIYSDNGTFVVIE